MRHDDYPTDDRVVERAEHYDEQLDVETQEFYTFDHDEDEAWENAQRHHPYLREDEL